MNTRTPLIISTLLILAMAAASLWAWQTVPEGARIPVHWGLDGTPNGFASKTEALFLMPGIAAAMTALFALWPHIEPRRGNLEASSQFYRAVWIAVVALLAFVHAVILLSASGETFDVGAATIAGVSILIVVIGNFLAKTRSNFIAGFRTPWTLSSEYSWQKTHRLAGWLFVLTGIATFVTLVALGSVAAFQALFAGLAIAAVSGVVMSYVYWRRDPERHESDTAVK